VGGWFPTLKMWWLIWSKCQHSQYQTGSQSGSTKPTNITEYNIYWTSLHGQVFPSLPAIEVA